MDDRGTEISGEGGLGGWERQCERPRVLGGSLRFWGPGANNLSYRSTSPRVSFPFFSFSLPSVIKSHTHTHTLLPPLPLSIHRHQGGEQCPSPKSVTVLLPRKSIFPRITIIIYVAEIINNNNRGGLIINIHQIFGVSSSFFSSISPIKKK